MQGYMCSIYLIWRRSLQSYIEKSGNSGNLEKQRWQLRMGGSSHAIWSSLTSGTLFMWVSNFFLFSKFHKSSIGMCHVCVNVVVVNWYSVVRYWQREVVAGGLLGLTYLKVKNILLSAQSLPISSIHLTIWTSNSECAIKRFQCVLHVQVIQWHMWNRTCVKGLVVCRKCAGAWLMVAH